MRCVPYAAAGGVFADAMPDRAADVLPLRANRLLNPAKFYSGTNAGRRMAIRLTRHDPTAASLGFRPSR